MFRLFKFSATTRRQVALLPLLLVIFSGTGHAQTAFTFDTDPAVFEEGDTINIAYSVTSSSSIDQISFSHALDRWEVNSSCTPEVILDNSWFCPNNSCEVTVGISESRDSIHVLLLRSSSSPVSGSGEVLTLKGIEVMIEDVWLRKAGPATTDLCPFSVSPNPCSDLLMIENCLEGQEGILLMRNLQGQIVWTEPIQSEMMKASVGHLPTGLYWLQAVREDGIGQAVPVRIMR